MDVLEAIKTRRSVGLVSEKPVPQDLLEQILEAGTWAPCHHRTEPWRYFVLTGEGRKPLGEALAKIAERDMEDPSTESNQKKLAKRLKKPFRAPTVIVVAAEPTDDPKVLAKEEYGAVYSSIQNMLLAAHALGLGGFWRTGKPTYDPLMQDLFGLSKDGEVLGFLYIGFPEKDLPAGDRKHINDVTKWISTADGLKSN
ncbi:nitroreductase [Halobacillus shinanisalinarum]|uniref:Putative NAD(P)H nitroreductase n=1 Tax=Halobacillus shinanisalinarum TaxID=2932258 RepID=A0ABY4H3D3_9BACI|nr:nitroreductase [Halobacillus shinanisalinarum]UOQ93487.1 nitroreductase [Halobacillus shinanisalinarum]